MRRSAVMFKDAARMNQQCTRQTAASPVQYHRSVVLAGAQLGAVELAAVPGNQEYKHETDHGKHRMAEQQPRGYQSALPVIFQIEHNSA